MIVSASMMIAMNTWTNFRNDDIEDPFLSSELKISHAAAPRRNESWRCVVAPLREKFLLKFIHF